MVCDSTGAIWVTGVLRGRLQIGTQVLSAAGRDFFILKMAPDGEVLHAAHYGDSLSQTALGIALLPDDGVVVVGGFFGGSQLRDRWQPCLRRRQ